MSDVRSQRLAQFTSTSAGYTKIWTTPSGMVTLLKHITVTNETPGPVYVQVYLRTEVTGQVISGRQLAYGESYTWQGWAVLNPLDHITVYAGSQGVKFWLSGAVLIGWPPVPPQAPTPDTGTDFFSGPTIETGEQTKYDYTE